MRNKILYSHHIETVTSLEKKIEQLQTSLLHLSILNGELKALTENAERLHTDQQDLMSSMSKEVLGPLQGIMSLSDLIEGTSLDKEQQGYLNLIKIAGNTLIDTMGGMLTLSKATNRSETPSQIIFNFSEKISRVISNFEGVARRKKISISTFISPQIPVLLKGDADSFEQVILGILNNALSFSYGGSLELHFELDKLIYNDVFLKCRINKKGILAIETGEDGKIKVVTDKDMSEKLKEDFSTAISRRLVEHLQGEFGINVSSRAEDISEEDHFTEFWFVVPMSVAGDDLPEPQAGEAGQNIQVPQQTDVRILLAEDNEVNQLIVARNLAELGYEIDLAGNGQEAVDMVQRHSYQLILMDINMPVMDGVRATQIIREQFDTQTPIMAITANSFESDRKKYFEVGMNDYLKKPFRKEELLSSVEKLISS